MKALYSPFLGSLLALCALLLTGCGNIGQKSSPSKFYVLTSMPESTDSMPEFANDPPNVGVPMVEIPKFLDRPQITFRLNNNEVQFNEFARWAEPLGDGFTRVLRENLTLLMGSGKVAAFPYMQPFPRQMTLTVVVTDFAASADGKAQLSVIYRIADSKNQETYKVKEATYYHNRDGGLTNENAVIALSSTLRQFSIDAAKEIAAVDRELQKEKTE